MMLQTMMPELSKIMILVANIVAILLSFGRSWRENLRMITACAFIMILIWVYRALTGDSIGLLQWVSGGVLFLPSLYFIHSGSMAQKIFVTCTVLSITYLLYIVSSFAATALVGYGGFLFIVWHFVILLLALILYVLVMIRYGRRLTSRMFSATDRWIWRLYAVYPTMSILLLWPLYRGTDVTPPAELYSKVMFYVLPFFAIAGLVMLFVSILRTYENARTNYELQLARHAVSAGREYYEKLTNALHDIRVLRHDYKQQLGAIVTLLESGQTRVAREVFLETQKRYEAAQGEAIYCENPILSALISHHAGLLAQNNIDFSVSAQIGADSPLDHYELCLVIGNLLENAREACLPVPEDERHVKLKVISDKIKLVLEITNSFDGIVKTDENGFPISRKPEGGYGLCSVRSVCDLHDGLCRQSWTANEYTVYVVLNY